MAVYFITGKLGSGKTLCAVGRIKEYLEQGRKVATNLDLNLACMLPETSIQSVSRTPDKPRLSDLELLGLGCEEEDESKYGLIVLDELGTWFNSRNWRDKERLDVIDWFLHARKKHWDIFFIVQSIDTLDSQLVTALAEHVVVCKRTDRLSLPIIGGLLRFLGFDKTMPKVHVANVYYGQTASSPRVARWVYRGRDLYNSYNTAQIFTDETILINDELVDFRASYTILSSAHIHAVKYKQQLLNKINSIKTSNQPARSTSGGAVLPFSFNYSYLSIFVLLALGVYGFTRSPIEESLALNPVSTVSALPSPIKKQNSNYMTAVYQPSEAKLVFIDRLLTQYRPRLAAFIHSAQFNKTVAVIEFYEDTTLVERLDIKALHAFGVAVVVKPYGVDLVTAVNDYPVTAWALPKPQKQEKQDHKQINTPTSDNQKHRYY